MSSDNKVIAVFSPIGGTGVSTVAVNVAYTLARKVDTALIDLVLDFGSVTDFLEFAPKFRVDQIPVDSIVLGSQLMTELSLPQRKSLKVFAAPNVTAQQFDLKALIRTCRQTFRFTLLDLPHTLMVSEVETALNEADKIVLVCTYGWETISQIAIFLEEVASDRKRRNWFQKSIMLINKVEWLPKDVLEQCKKQIVVPIFSELSLDPGITGLRETIQSGRKLFDEFEQVVKKIELLH